MFKNVSGKLKSLSKIVVWLTFLIGTIASIAYSASMNSVRILLIYFVITLIATFAVYISALFVYGFAQMIEDVKEIKQNLYDVKQNSTKECDNNIIHIEEVK